MTPLRPRLDEPFDWGDDASHVYETRTSQPHGPEGYGMLMALAVTIACLALLLLLWPR
ncbi:MAG: hypothetical protein GIW99_01845 [Candidatus Eremiobacteraeota bacterium]|nr:hypothetical protein [Candidatus Eremiobacteraeota bacterium]MBC5826418.1 hypothetical protein [Candidatus Eremiobacteraeota bacterium]